MTDSTDRNEGNTETPVPPEDAGSVAVKDLDYYTAHPEEIPEDARGIDGLAQDMVSPEEESSQEDASQKDETGEKEPSDQKPQDSKQDADAASSGREPVIRSKSGKEIPYIALVSEREKARRAQHLVEQLEARNRELEEALASRSEGKESPLPKAPGIDDESMREIVEDFPALKKMLEHSANLEKELSSVKQKFQVIEQAERERQAASERAAQEEVRAIVDGDPYLLYYEQHAPEKWSAAIEADNALKKLANGLSTKERLEKVVEVVELVMGATELPPEFATMKTAPSGKPPPNPPDRNEAIKQAEEAKRKPPRSLGEISGGSPPAPDELEEIANQRPEELERMARNNPERMEALLKRFG